MLLILILIFFFHDGFICIGIINEIKTVQKNDQVEIPPDHVSSLWKIKDRSATAGDEIHHQQKRIERKNKRKGNKELTELTAIFNGYISDSGQFGKKRLTQYQEPKNTL